MLLSALKFLYFYYCFMVCIIITEEEDLKRKRYKIMYIQEVMFKMKKRGDTDKKIKHYHKLFLDIKNECKKTIVGQDRVIEGLLRGIICDGHILVEGVPGIAKTLIVKTLAKVIGGTYSRVQFTADLLPTDITGLTIYDKTKGFSVVKGPVFSNFVIADEINRSPPKVQSALLEAMQEKQGRLDF